MKPFSRSKKKGGDENYLNKYFIPYTPLILLIIIVSVISYYRLLIQIDMGPLSDACDFILNALYFSGHGVGYYDWTRPPFFPFMVSLIFKVGFISTTTTFVVDLLFYIFGLIGFYLLLNLHFNKIESFLGGILFATFPKIIMLLGLGYSDFACGAFLIWAFYFLILAVKKNPKFFILVFPLFMMAFLTRFNAALVIFPLILYFYMNKNKIRHYKEIAWGILASILILIPVLWFYFEKFGSIIYPFVSTFGTTTMTFSSEYYPYDPNSLYFVERFFVYTGFESIIIIFIILIGLAIYSYTNIKSKPDITKNLINKLNIENNVLKLKLIIFSILTLFFIGSFGQIPYMASEVIFLAVSLVFFTLVKCLGIKDMDLHLLMFSWFMTFFVFNSVYVIKSDRYFILMAPAVAYFLLLGLTGVFRKLSVNFKKRNLIFPAVAAILTVMILFSTASLLPGIEHDNQDYKYSNEQIALASEWFAQYEPDYKNKIIYSDVWPYLAWFLKTDVKIMPIFKNNQAYIGGVKNTTFTPQDSAAFNDYLVQNNADYYFCVMGVNLTSYKPIKSFGTLVIYERI